MSGHDAASVVGALAGASTADPPKDAIRAEALVKRFCSDVEPGLIAEPGAIHAEGTQTSRGWCGFIGGRGDAWETGFESGYDFLGYLGERGWVPLHAKGNWPYVIHMRGASEDGKHAIAEYREGDLTVWIFDVVALANSHYEQLEEVA